MFVEYFGLNLLDSATAVAGYLQLETLHFDSNSVDFDSLAALVCSAAAAVDAEKVVLAPTEFVCLFQVLSVSLAHHHQLLCAIFVNNLENEFVS